MFKLISLVFVVLMLNESRGISLPTNDGSVLLSNPLFYKNKTKGQFASHFQDFVAIINIEDLMDVVMKYVLSDLEVIQFMAFVFSPEMQELMSEFQSMAEFKEAKEFLVSKGYDVRNDLHLPRFEIPKLLVKSGQGVNGLIEELLATLPLEDMKKLFESKLETSPEVAELFNTINSEEFLDIMRRMSQNPKFLEIKAIFEIYGFDFKYICQLAIGILGDYYQGVFCL